MEGERPRLWGMKFTDSLLFLLRSLLRMGSIRKNFFQDTASRRQTLEGLEVGFLQRSMVIAKWNQIHETNLGLVTLESFFSKWNTSLVSCASFLWCCFSFSLFSPLTSVEPDGASCDGVLGFTSAFLPLRLFGFRVDASSGFSILDFAAVLLAGAGRVLSSAGAFLLVSWRGSLEFPGRGVLIFRAKLLLQRCILLAFSFSKLFDFALLRTERPLEWERFNSANARDGNLQTRLVLSGSAAIVSSTGSFSFETWSSPSGFSCAVFFPRPRPRLRPRPRPFPLPFPFLLPLLPSSASSLNALSGSSSSSCSLATFLSIAMACEERIPSLATPGEFFNTEENLSWYYIYKAQVLPELI